MKRWPLIINLLFLFSVYSVELFADTKIDLFSMGLEHATSRGALLSGMFDTHLENLIATIDSFSLIKDENLRLQLNSSDKSDRFLLNFAKRAEIPVIIKGSVIDRGEYVLLRLYAFAYEAPYNGQLTAHHEVEIPVLPSTNTRELSYIMEEHTGRFLSELLDTYSRPVHFTVNNGIASVLDDVPDGTYYVYRITATTDNVTGYEQAGITRVYSGTVKQGFPDGDYFVLQNFKKEAKFLDDFFYGRKKEIVYQKNSIENTAIAVLATPVLSIISPVGTPVSYTLTSDYTGLGLWGLNNTPYLYIASKGIFDSPDNLKKNSMDVSRFDRATHYFSWYYFLAGGMSLYVDAVGHNAKNDAANYIQAAPFTGSPDIALYLSLLGSGSGHFYKGYRGWGYFYFHADNMLLLSSLYFLSEEETYTNGSYSRSNSDKSLGYGLLGAAAAVRVFEVIHCLQMPFNISNGKEIDNKTETVPEFKSDTSEGGLFFGLSFSKKL